MELKDIIEKAKNENCIVVSEKHKYYYITCEFMTINDITFSNNIKIEIHEIDNTIYFGGFWIDKDDIKNIDFTGRKDYKIL